MPKARPLKQHDHLMNCTEYFASSGAKFIVLESEDQKLDREAGLPNEQIEFPEEPAAQRNKLWQLALRRFRLRKTQPVDD
jgi:hypothetical protein